ncbi:retrovirus-related pol polyprotein from transposon TNT 1-94, partial [Tanacetum coccineum]
ATTTPPRSDPISSLSPTIRSNQRPDPLLITLSLPSPLSETQKRRNIIMAMISAFITVDKTAQLSNNLMGYVDGSIPCPSKTLSVTDGATVPKENPNYPIWVSNDAYVRMLIISAILEASFRHVQGTTSRDLWLSFKKAYAPHSTSREYTLKAQLLRIEIHGDETPDAYLNRAQEYATLIACGQDIKYNPRFYNLSITDDFRLLYVIFSSTSPFTPEKSKEDAPIVVNLKIHVIVRINHPSPSSPRSPISSPSSVLHLSLTSQTSSESSNGQPSPVSTTSIPTPPPPTPPPPPPLITQQRPANLRYNPKQRWRQAMKEEYDALMKNETWPLVPCASNTNLVDGKWVYRLKRDKSGAITRYKARFVAQGFRQQPGIDFHETFSPVVKSTTIQATTLVRYSECISSWKS